MLIHEDYLNGHSFHDEIKKYSYFKYDVNEALHISPNEEKIIGELFHKIDLEYVNNQDEFSKEIILSHIQSLLKYASRFYKRQFINKTTLSGHTVKRFNEIMTGYLKKDIIKRAGLPTVKCVPSKLNFSPQYLSDLLKTENGLNSNGTHSPISNIRG